LPEQAFKVRSQENGCLLGARIDMLARGKYDGPSCVFL
jgi:hypothetical protein